MPRLLETTVMHGLVVTGISKIQAITFFDSTCTANLSQSPITGTCTFGPVIGSPGSEPALILHLSAYQLSILRAE